MRGTLGEIPMWLVIGEILGGVIAVGLVLLFGLPYLVRMPESAPLPIPSPVPDEQNAWLALLPILDRLHPPIDQDELDATDAEMRRIRGTKEWKRATQVDWTNAKLTRHSDNPAVQAFERAMARRIGFRGEWRDPAVLVAELGREGLEELIGQVRTALTRPELRMPEPRADPLHEANRLRRHAALRDTEMLLIIRAEQLRREGDTAGMLRDLLDGVALGMRCGDGYGQHLDYALAGIPSYEITRALGPPPAGVSLEEQDPTVSWPPTGWSSEDWRMWRGALDELRGWSFDATRRRRYLVGDFLGLEHMHRRAADFDAHPGILRGYGCGARTALWDTIHSDAVLAAAYADAMERVVLPPYRRDLDRIARHTSPRGIWRWYNPVGRSGLGYSVGSLPVQLGLVDHLACHHELVVLAVALKLYQERHGRLPATWQPLVDDGLLEEVPVDPYSGEPLPYEPRRGRIYSVGAAYDPTDPNYQRARIIAERHRPVVGDPYEADRAMDPPRRPQILVLRFLIDEPRPGSFGPHIG